MLLEIKPAPNSDLSPKHMENFLNLLHTFKFRKFQFQLIRFKQTLHIVFKVPNKLSDQIKNLLYGNYPNCQIKKIKSIPKLKSKYFLKLKRHEQLSLKTYTEIPESLGSLLSNISQHLAIQIKPRLKSSTNEFQTIISTNSPVCLKSFGQFNTQSYFKTSIFKKSFTLSSVELASIFHLPTKDCQVQNLN